MYAVLPYKVAGLSIDAPPDATRNEQVEIRVAVAATTDDVGPHAVHLEVSLPDGRKPEYLAQTLYLPEGKAAYTFVPALNSPAGRWSVSAVEAVSGEQATVDFDVR